MIFLRLGLKRFKTLWSKQESKIPNKFESSGFFFQNILDENRGRGSAGFHF